MCARCGGYRYTIGPTRFVTAPLNCNIANNALVREHLCFPLGGKYPEGGIEGTAPKVRDQAEKTHLGTLFSQKRFQSAFFDSFPQGEAFAACGRDGGARTEHFAKLQISSARTIPSTPNSVTTIAANRHALAEGPAFKLQFIVAVPIPSGANGVTIRTALCTHRISALRIKI